MKKYLITSFIAFAMLFAGQQGISQNVKLAADSIVLQCGQSGTVTVPIRVSNFTDIGSIDFSFAWDTRYLTYKYSTGFGPEFTGLSNVFTDSDTSASNIAQGQFTFTWLRLGGHTIPTNDAELFSVVFEYNGLGPAGLDFPSTPTPTYFTDNTSAPVPFDIETGFVGPIDMDLPTFDCPGDVIIPNAMGAQTTPSSIALSNLVDNCAIQSVGYELTGATQGTFPTTQDASAQVFQPGMTTVTYTVTDVGNNVATCNFLVDLQVADDTLTLFSQASSTADCGNTFFVDIKSLNFDTLGSLDFSLEWQSGFLSYDSVGMFHPDLGISLGSNFNENQSQATPNAQLGFSWFTGSLAGTNIPAGETLFRLYYTVIGAAGNSTDVVFGDNPTTRNAYRQMPYEEIPVRFENSSVLITDMQNPTITCPTNITTPPDAGSIYAALTGLDPASISDNCGLTGYSHSIDYNGQTTTGQFAADGQFGPGTSTITYTAIDDANNTATCSFSVTVAMVTAAAFDFDTAQLGCKHNDTATVCIRVADFANVAGVQFAVRWDDAVLEFLDYSDVPPAIAGGFFFASPTPSTTNELRVVGSNSAGWPDLMDGDTFMCIRFLIKMDGVSDVGIFDSPAYVFEATDSNSDKIPSSTVGGYVNALDSQAPSYATTCQNNLSFDAPAGQCSRMVSWNPIIATDDCGIVDSTGTHGVAGDIFPVGVTQVLYTATDASGNTASCSFEVEILDLTSPSFNGCPTDLTVDLMNSCMASGNWTPPVPMDECLAIDSTSNNIDPDSLLPVGVYNVAYMAFDSSGNGNTCSFILTIQDTDAPVFSSCPADQTIELAPTACTASVNWIAPTLTDACLPMDGGVTTNVASDSMLSSGVYMIEFNGVDSAGNAAVPCTFMVTVSDTIAPVLSSCPSDTTVYVDALNCTVMGGWTAPILTDACLPSNGGLTSNITSDSLLSPGMYTVTYMGTDGSNTVSCDFSVIVLDTIAPVIMGCPEDTVSTSNPFTYNFAVPSAMDNCGMPTLVFSHISGTMFSNDTTVIIYAQDASGNRDSCVFSITVGTGCTSNPQITNCPSDSMFVDMGCTATVTYAPLLSGFCNPNTNTTITITDANAQVFMNGAVLPIGIYDVAISVSNASGENATCPATTITVSETEMPELACPAAVVLDVAGNVLQDDDGFIASTTTLMDCTGAVVNFNMPMATDNCDSNPLTSQTGGPLSGVTFIEGTSFFEFLAIDDSGNSSTCLTSITMEALEPFMITANASDVCPGASVTLSTAAYPNAIYTWSGPGGNFPNSNTITIDPFGTANVGTYDLSIETNGCEIMSSDMISLDIVTMPIANDDLLSVVESMALSNIDVVANDSLVPTNYTVTMVNPAQGVSMVSNGIFDFEGTATPKNITFDYLLCAAECPSLCDTGTVTISVKNTRCDFIPNVITPNDDGINDEFLIPCLEFGDYPNATITIYSQWGDVVFEADPYEFSKASAFKGLKDNDPEAVLPDGVYYYIFRTADGDAPYKGFIQLYR